MKRKIKDKDLCFDELDLAEQELIAERNMLEYRIYAINMIIKNIQDMKEKFLGGKKN